MIYNVIIVTCNMITLIAVWYLGNLATRKSNQVIELTNKCMQLIDIVKQQSAKIAEMERKQCQ